MKECPVCRTTYTDESLRYCLSDGSQLVPSVGDHPTVIDRAVQTNETLAMPSMNKEVRIDIPRPPEQPTQLAASPQASSSSGILKVLVVLLLVSLFVVIVGAAGVIFYMRSGPVRTSVDPGSNVKASTPAAASTADDKDELRDQIANLEKMLKDQKRSDRPANVQPNIPNQSPLTTTARVNSPSDGFLALRTLPNSELGERILKIPHGATISIGTCGPVMTPVSRSGRWCQASYNGYRGWVFDAYLIY